nr:CopL family metal-binding regulatory protein [Xanthomonas fragariae]
MCLVANTAIGAWASVAMAMPQVASAAMAQAASTAHATIPAALPCHDGMLPHAAMQLSDKTRRTHAADCRKLGSCDCLQHCSPALPTLPAVPAGLLGHAALPATRAEGRSSPVPEQPVRPPIA